MRRTPLKKQSLKQRHRETDLRAQKEAHIIASLAADGFVCCQECGRPYTSPGEARSALQGHHIVQRSLGGGDEAENIRYLCWKCHGEKHP